MCTIAVCLKNRLPYSAVKDRTPYKVLHSKIPIILHLQPFGTKCFVYILEEARPSGSKLQLRAKVDLLDILKAQKSSRYTYYQKDRLFILAMFTSLRVPTQKGYNYHLYPYTYQSSTTTCNYDHYSYWISYSIYSSYSLLRLSIH